MQETRKVVLPPPPRSSAVTPTLSEGTKTSYPEVLATTRQKVPLFGNERVKIKKGMTGRVILGVPDRRQDDNARDLP